MGIIAKGPTATITDESMQGADGRGYLQELPKLWEQLVLMVEGFSRRESTSFHNNTLGTKTFVTLPNGIEWPAGLRLQVINQANEDQSLFGHISSHDAEAGNVTVEVTGATGDDGTWSSSTWVLFITGYQERSDLPLNSIENGFTGANSPAGARSNLECLRLVTLDGIQVDPPATVVPGKKYLLLDPDTLSELPCSGAWAGHEGRFAIGGDSDSWAFEDAQPFEGTLAIYDNATSIFALFTLGDWLQVSKDRPQARILSGINAEETYPVDASWLEAGLCTVFLELTNGQTPTVTLPAANPGDHLTLRWSSGPDVEIDSSGVSLGFLRSAGSNWATLVSLGGTQWRVAQGALDP